MFVAPQSTQSFREKPQNSQGVKHPPFITN